MPDTTVAVIGGGVVGAAVLFTLAHRGIAATLLEADTGLAYGASGTNSGVLHTGFDAKPGELETALILRAARVRDPVLDALGVPVLRCGAELAPSTDAERATVAGLAENARRNGVPVHVRAEGGALVVPGESITDPVAYTLALADAAVRAGAAVLTDARVEGIDQDADGLTLHLAEGEQLTCSVAINGSGFGDAASSACVYGCSGRSNSSLVSATSTSEPRYITPTRSEMYLTTARLWAMNR